MRATVIVLALVSTSIVAADPTRDLDKARTSFKAGDWQSALPILNALLYPKPNLASTSELVEAYVLLGVCAFETGDRDRAKVEFENALALQPDKTLDTLLFSSGAVRVFDETRRDLEERSKRDAKERELREKEEALRKFRESLRIYETHPFYMNFFPFGLAQLQNKQRGKAALFAVGHTATLLPSVGIWLYLATKYGLESTHVPLQDGPTVRHLQQIEIASGIGFIGLYIWSVIDAYRNYEPARLVKGDDSLLPPNLRDEPKKPLKKTSFGDRLRLGPILTPNGVGLGLSLESD